MDQNMQSEYARQKKKSFRNSMISIAALSFVTVAIFSAQTYAYFTENANSDDNRIVSGNLDIELIEMQNTQQGQVAYVNPVSIMPATSVSKIVSVQNSGSLPVYIRVKIEKSINKSENEIPEGWENLITCNFKLDNVDTPETMEGLWTYHDGYYYYNNALTPGSTTAPLFDTVHFSHEMGNEFTNSEIRFAVICQATQANGNSDSALTAWGWPSEGDTPANDAADNAEDEMPDGQPEDQQGDAQEQDAAVDEVN